MLCISSSQVQHRFGHRHSGEQSTNQSGPLASAGSDSQPAQRHAQRGQRAAHRGRESTRHRRPQPRHQPVHWGSARGNEARVRPSICSVITFRALLVLLILLDIEYAFGIKFGSSIGLIGLYLRVMSMYCK